METAHKIRGEELFKEEKYEEASEELRKALTSLKERFTNNQVKDQREGRKLIKTVKLPTLKTLSECLFKVQKFQECEEVCNKILGIDNDCADTIYMKGECKMKGQDVDEAVTLFQRAHFLQSNNKTFQNSFNQAQSQFHLKHALKFWDRQVAKIGWYLGWLISIVKSLLGLLPFIFKVYILTFKFFYRNGERIVKAVTRLVGSKVDNFLWYFSAGSRNGNKWISKYSKSKLSFSRKKTPKAREEYESDTSVELKQGL